MTIPGEVSTASGMGQRITQVAASLGLRVHSIRRMAPDVVLVRIYFRPPIRLWPIEGIQSAARSRLTTRLAYLLAMTLPAGIYPEVVTVFTPPSPRGLTIAKIRRLLHRYTRLKELGISIDSRSDVGVSVALCSPSPGMAKRLDRFARRLYFLGVREVEIILRCGEAAIVWRRR